MSYDRKSKQTNKQTPKPRLLLYTFIDHVQIRIRMKFNVYWFSLFLMKLTTVLYFTFMYCTVLYCTALCNVLLYSRYVTVMRRRFLSVNRGPISAGWSVRRIIILRRENFRNEKYSLFLPKLS